MSSNKAEPLALLDPRQRQVPAPHRPGRRQFDRLAQLADLRRHQAADFLFHL